MKHLLAVMMMSLTLGALADFVNNKTDATGFPLILPQPQKVTQTKSFVELSDVFTVTAPRELPLSSLQRVLKTQKIRFATSENGFCQFILKKTRTSQPEGYQLTIDEKGIRVTASQMDGLFDGVQTVCWILRNTEGKKLQGCHIEDYPDLPFRAVYLECNYTAPINFDLLERAFQTLSLLKYNAVVVDFGDKFPLNGKSLPNAKSPFSVEDVRRFQQMAAENHLEIVPLVQCISHAWWMIRHPDYLTKFAETPQKNWSSRYCPCSEEAKQLALDYVKSHLELLKPRYFHIALDEIYRSIPHKICERCKKQNYKKKIADHARDLCTLVRSHGATPIIFDDQFRTTSWLNGPLASLLDTFDKSTIINIWEYAPNPSPRMADELVEKGFSNFLYMSWHEKLENTINLPIIAAQSHSLGHILAWWNYIRPTLDYQTGQSIDAFASIALSASYSWNAGQPYYTQYQYDPIQIFRALYEPEKLVPMASMKATPLPIGQAFNAICGDSLMMPQFTQPQLKQLQKELASLPGHYQLVCQNTSYRAVAISGDEKDPFAKKPVALPVGTKAKVLSFLMAGVPWNDVYLTDKAACDLIVKYADGSQVTEPLVLGTNLIQWNSYSSAFVAEALLKGRDKNNAIYTLGAYHWQNPSPDKEIAQVVFAPSKKTKVATMILAVSAMDADKAPMLDSMVKAQSMAPLPDNREVSFSSLLDLKNGLPKGTLTQHKKELFDGNVTYTVKNEKEEYFLEIQVPPLKKGTVIGRVTVDIPIHNVNQVKTLRVDRELSHPEGIHRADAYFLQGGKANSFLNYDARIGTDGQRLSFDIPVDKPVEFDEGGVDFTKPNINVRIGFFVNNVKPMTIRIYDVSVSKQEPFYVARCFR